MIVTSLILLTLLIANFDMFKLQVCDTKYIIPPAIECGVFSGIKCNCSILKATNLHKFVSSLLIHNLLQNLSINELGVVLLNEVISSFISLLCSKSLITESAFLQPFVALALSKLKILAISFAVDCWKLSIALF